MITQQLLKVREISNMALQYFSLAAGAFNDDSDGNGNNYIPGIVVEIQNLNGTLANIFSDEAGTSPITQDGTQNVTDNKGLFSFFIDSGNYKALSGGNEYPFGVGFQEDHNLLNGLNSPGGHDEIYQRSFEKVQDMVSYSDHQLGRKYTTGATSWLVNETAGIDLGDGLFARPLNGIWINDWGVDESGVTSIDDSLEQALEVAESGGFKVNAVGNGAVYLITRQHTVRHNTSLNFNGAKVDFVQSTTNNDSPFQMGNNTTLRNISEGTYQSISADSFSTLGWVKVGEFYAEIDGSPSAGENSLDSSYWQPDNVTVENVHTNMSQQADDDSRGYGKTVGHYSATNCTYRNLSCDGLCADGNPSKSTTSTVRTETGVDINEGRQGFNIVIENIKGSNLRAKSEDAVVYLNGDRNTKISNVVGDSCGAVLGIRPNRFFATQDPSMRGRSGLNIVAENIIGTNCRKVAGDTSTHLFAAVYLRSNEGDDLSNNKSQFTVKNVAVFSTSVEADKLDLGIQMGDPVALPGETNVGTRRVTLDGFEVVGFNDGINEEEGCIESNIKNGFVRNCGKNGGTLRGLRSLYENIKFWENNQLANPDANNGHGVRIGFKQSVMRRCSFGNEALGFGNETQKSGVYIVAADTNGRLEGCFFDNYQSGQNVLQQRAVTNCNVYVDQFCKSKNQTIGKSSFYHLSPDVVKVQANFDSTGSTSYQLGCSVSQNATGNYAVTFDKPMANADYRVVMTSNFQYVAERTTAKTVNGFEIRSRNVSGTDVDSGFDFVVYGDYSTEE